MQSPIRGQYQTLELLGAGGMGEVYKAKDLKLNRLVALKILRHDDSGDPGRRKRFIQEAQAASALNHPNIITIHDIISEEGVEIMVMEMVNGRTLNDLIPRNGLRVSQVINYAAQVADALSAAHSIGIIHRDLKPGNIMVTDRDLVKLLDFGLAKVIPSAFTVDSDETNMAPLTVQGSIVGTMCYMSPEQAQGLPADSRSDVFSFGAVLYEMATGLRAFNGENGISMLSSVLRDNPRSAVEITPELPPILSDVIHKCLEKDPKNRFQTMVELRDGLLRLRAMSDSGALYAAPPTGPAAAAAAAAAPALSSVSAPQSPAAQPVMPHVPINVPPMTPQPVPQRGTAQFPTGGMPAPAPVAAAKPKSTRLPEIIAASVLGLAAIGGTGAWFVMRQANTPQPLPEPPAPPPVASVPVETPPPANPESTPTAAPASTKPSPAAAKPAAPAALAKSNTAPAPTAVVPIPAPAAAPAAAPVAPPPVVQAAPAEKAALLVAVQDATPVQLELLNDIPNDAEPGFAIHFRVMSDVKVGNEIVIAKGAPATGEVVSREGKKRFLVVGRGTTKITVAMKTVTAPDGSKLKLRATSAAEGESTRTLETPGQKSKTVAVSKGTQTLGYTAGSQTVKLRR